MLNLDPWQAEILSAKGNLVLCSGRQVGKSTIISINSSEYAIRNASKSILIISSTERQAEELFIKCLNYIHDNYKSFIKKGKDRPTKHIIKLSNGSVIRSLPAGLAGIGVRGYTLDRLIVDEAAFVEDDVFTSLTPSLLTTGGDIILVSTPHGKKGYFYEMTKSPTFTVFHVNSEMVIRERALSSTWTEHQRQSALEHLERQKQVMSKLEYAQEYMGEFIDDLLQYFPDELIRKCMTRKRPNETPSQAKTYFLGVDIARLGQDLSVFAVLDRTKREKLVQVESIATSKTRLNQTTDKILELDRAYNFKEIYVDDGGIGSGVFDYLLVNEQTKRKVVAINNRARPLDRNEEYKKKILKEDLYNNLLMLMEQGKIELLDDDEIFYSLKSVQYEYTVIANSPTKLRIFGNYTHHAESLIRAAWCTKDKRLNIWVR